MEISKEAKETTIALRRMGTEIVYLKDDVLIEENTRSCIKAYRFADPRNPEIYIVGNASDKKRSGKNIPSTK